MLGEDTGNDRRRYKIRERLGEDTGYRIQERLDGTQDGLGEDTEYRI